MQGMELSIGKLCDTVSELSVNLKASNPYCIIKLSTTNCI